MKKSAKKSNITKTADEGSNNFESGVVEVEVEVAEKEKEEFWPAYMLADWSLERAGRLAD